MSTQDDPSRESAKRQPPVVQAWNVLKVIGKCPRDGRYWKPQCARCGSSMSFEDCDNCAGEGWIEDEDWQADEGDGWDCDWCHGEGGHWVCLSSAEWCEAQPRPDRTDMKRGTVEWFTFDGLTNPLDARKP